MTDAIKKSLTDTVKDTAKDTVKDTAKDTAKDAAKSVKDTAKEHIKDKLMPESWKQHETTTSGGGGGDGGEKKDMNALFKSFGGSFLAAGTAAMAAKTLVAPVELRPTSHETSVSTQQGYMTYWRGNLSNVVRAFPNEGLNFGLRDYYNYALGVHKIDAHHEPWRYFWMTYFSGGAAGVVSLAALYPIDAAYGSRLPTDISRVMTEELHLKGGSMKEFDPVKAGQSLRDTAIDAEKTIKGRTADLGRHMKETAQDVGKKVKETAQDVGHKVREGEYRSAAERMTGSMPKAEPGGLFGLYRGFMPSLMGAFVYRAAYFGLYDTVRAMYPDKSSFLWGWAMAQATTTTSGYLAHPFDVIRHRMMIHRDNYNGSWDCWMKTLRNEGMSAFYRGGSSNLVRSTGGALTLVFYDEIKKYMSNKKWMM